MIKAFTSWSSGGGLKVKVTRKFGQWSTTCLPCTEAFHDNNAGEYYYHARKLMETRRASWLCSMRTEYVPCELFQRIISPWICHKARWISISTAMSSAIGLERQDRRQFQGQIRHSFLDWSNIRSLVLSFSWYKLFLLASTSKRSNGPFFAWKFYKQAISSHPEFVLPKEIDTNIRWYAKPFACTLDL